MNYRFMEGLTLVFVIIAMFSVAFITSDSEKLSGMAVTERCDIACYTSSDCNDNNVCTTDLCMLPGKCSAQCYNREIQDCTQE